jgi:hypothetical protein
MIVPIETSAPPSPGSSSSMITNQQHHASISSINNNNNTNGGTLRHAAHGRQYQRWVLVLLGGSLLMGVYIVSGTWSQLINNDANEFLLHTTKDASAWNNGDDPGETMQSLQSQHKDDGVLQ